MSDNDIFFTMRGYEKKAGEDALSPSMEDYIEMIYRISEGQGFTRVNDLAGKLNVQPPSVTKMIKKLHEKSLLEYEKYGAIQLTAKGKRVGEFLLLRHNILREFLDLIGAGDNLQKNVEQIEHYISSDTLESLHALVRFFKANPQILQLFYDYKNP